MSKIEVNQISSQCGSTLTIGQSGDSIQLACGATQTGFGRTGTVDWDTTAKTASFTAVSGTGYFVNTTSGAITVTLPASPSAGNIVAVADYAGTAVTNNITIARNGSNIEGGTDNATLDVNRESKTFVYVDATQGWVVVNSNDESAIPSLFLTATGGTITTCGNCKIHTFTGPGTFCVSAVGACSANNIVSYMVVAGGGGAGSKSTGIGSGAGGGGGAGGFREDKSPVTPYTASPLDGAGAITVTATAFPITVGAGGAKDAGCSTGATVGAQGGTSTFSTKSSAGGGGGGGAGFPTGGTGGDGGSGGGGGGADTVGGAGTGNTPPVSPSQGNNGGGASPGRSGGAGGGASGTGEGGYAGGKGGAGGNGVSTSITGSSVARSGGGSGGSYNTTCFSSGGTGGGGTGGYNPNVDATDGTTNTGGGGGGSAGGSCHSGTGLGGNGGSGIVVIRYKYQ